MKARPLARRSVVLRRDKGDAWRGFQAGNHWNRRRPRRPSRRRFAGHQGTGRLLIGPDCEDSWFPQRTSASSAVRSCSRRSSHRRGCRGTLRGWTDHEGRIAGRIRGAGRERPSRSRELATCPACTMRPSVGRANMAFFSANLCALCGEILIPPEFSPQRMQRDAEGTTDRDGTK